MRGVPETLNLPEADHRTVSGGRSHSSRDVRPVQIWTHGKGICRGLPAMHPNSPQSMTAPFTLVYAMRQLLNYITWRHPKSNAPTVEKASQLQQSTPTSSTAPSISNSVLNAPCPYKLRSSLRISDSLIPKLSASTARPRSKTPDCRITRRWSAARDPSTALTAAIGYHIRSTRSIRRAAPPGLWIVSTAQLPSR